MAKLQLPHIAIEVNNSCNQDCVFCYNHIPHNQLESNSSFKKVKTLLKKIYSKADVYNIVFTGGEPLLDSRISEIVLYAKMHKSTTTIITNGTLLNQEIIDDLLLIKNDMFQLPIHSYNRDIHDKMTKLRGSHAKSVNAIKRIVDSKSCLAVVIVLTKENAQHVDKTIGFILALGVKQISVDRYNIGGPNKDNRDDILPELDSLKDCYTLINRCAKHYNISITSNVCTPHCVLNPKDYPYIRFGNCPEDSKGFPLTIDLSGNLRVCNHSPNVVGNIFETEIVALLGSEYVRSWNRIPIECDACEMWSICRGGCRAASEQVGGTNLDIDPICSYLNEMK